MRYQERCEEERQAYQQQLDTWVESHGEETVVYIMDNAPIHPKGVIQAVVKAAGHEVLFLPKYSLDLNVIEHDFSALKRARMYAGSNSSIDEVIRKYYAG
ncbi:MULTISPECIES: transposase [unclassified Thermosynechococcus]|uniref:transposase n=1 Tax=unclassified Thermosynechococcus TaxID=2622553 RepID=UPI0037DD51FE